MKDLMKNDCVEKTRLFSGVFPEVKSNIKPLTSIQLRLRQKYHETKSLLALLQNKGIND